MEILKFPQVNLEVYLWKVNLEIILVSTANNV